jgi:hypothetical protein
LFVHCSFTEAQLPLLIEDAGRAESLIVAQEKEEQVLNAKIEALEKSGANKEELDKLKKQKETFRVRKERKRVENEEEGKNVIEFSFSFCRNILVLSKALV